MLSSSSVVLLLSAFLAFTLLHVEAYPLIAQVTEGTEKCFNFNIPEDDDAHMVFMALPMGEETADIAEGKLEGWLVQEVYQLTQAKAGGNLPMELLNHPPDNVKAQMEKYITKKGDNNSKMKLVISLDAKHPASRTLPIKYFSPTVINQVRESARKLLGASQLEEGEEADDLSGYEVCFDNTENEEDQVQIIMDIVFLAEESEDDRNEPNFVKEKHLSPLEESLDQSIKAANTVLREMKYMTDREERMRVTADSINQRVQYFSVFSVVILLVVTYIQVTYLKRYFKKKKLM